MQFNYEVRIGDINFGQHLAHDRLVTLLHDARTRFLNALGQSEVNFLGKGLILSQLAVKYIQQAFLHDSITIAVSATDFSSIKMKLDYRVKKGEATIATASTDMVFFDYEAQKVHKFDTAQLTTLLTPHQE